ncbi:MAG TPA: Ppx/GppA family phosphatase [Aquifex aeolicus]|nr:Ppx/GppA family phosphatase [Aquifex aeolicus]
MLIASIDIGSYSIRLTVAEIRDRKMEIIFEKGRITALGTKVKETGFLQEDRIKETLQVLEEYKKDIEKLKANEIVAVATEALRKAKNSQEFLNIVKKNLGIEVKIISPEEEGRYAYLAVAYSLNLEGKNCVIDQGGGSTEYIFGKKLNVERLISFPFGIVNLTETFFKHDPPEEGEIENLLSFLEERITKIKTNVDNLVGLGGTITTLVALEYNIYPYNPRDVHGKKLTLEQIKKWFEILREIPSKERSRLYKQIEDKRAEVILAGVGIFLKTLEIFEKEEIIVSDWGLREGVIVSKILNKNHS